MIALIFRCHLRIIFAGLLLFLVLFILAAFAQILAISIESVISLSWPDMTASVWIKVLSNMAKISFTISLLLQPVFHLVILIPMFFTKFGTIEKYYRNVEKRQSSKYGS